ncbi:MULTISPECIES: type I toxin-antitoxin system ptaRNA1 family toxin [Shewanella]|nr:MULTISPECIES: type I toxin-antitoxin system ptaRNA1 family toxin [Shewanella]EKT4485765.1 type I toxin-antitoxin system ptaRNA1 family toxin [Shewanella algae]MBO2636593.1 type I toxin-antitoxin system ptaRNA1 family toxin [Shewanella algae]
MTTTRNIEVQQAIHQAATKLAALEFIDCYFERKL